jgi:hypothetical protein
MGQGRDSEKNFLAPSPRCLGASTSAAYCNFMCNTDFFFFCYQQKREQLVDRGIYRANKKKKEVVFWSLLQPIFSNN